MMRYFYISLFVVSSSFSHGETIPQIFQDMKSDTFCQPKEEIDIALSQAIENVLCNDPYLKIQWTEVKNKVLQIDIEKSNYYPQLNLSSNYNIGKSNYKVKDAPQLSYKTDSERYGVSLQANLLVYDFGYKNSKNKLLTDLLNISLAQYNSSIQKVSMDVIERYYKILLLNENLKSIIQSESIAKKNLLISQTRYDVGTNNKSDVLSSYNNVLKIISKRNETQSQIEINMRSLGFLMGFPIEKEFSLKPIEINKYLEIKPINELINIAKEKHPDLISLDYKIDSAKNNIQVIKSENYPKVYITSDFLNNNRLGAVPFESVDNTIDFGIKISAPLFNGFKNHYRKIEAENQLEKTFNEKKLTEKDLSLEIINYYYELKNEEKNLQILENLKTNAFANVEITSGRYKNGVGNIIELLNSQNVFIEANENYNYSLNNFIITRYKLLTSIGMLDTKDIY